MTKLEMEYLLSIPCIPLFFRPMFTSRLATLGSSLDLLTEKPSVRTSNAITSPSTLIERTKSERPELPRSVLRIDASIILETSGICAFICPTDDERVHKRTYLRDD